MNWRERLKPFLTISNAVALVVLLLSAGVFVYLSQHPELNVFSKDGFQAFVQDLGWRGPVFYMIITAVAVVISQIPGVPLAMAAGALWGPLTAGIYSVIGGFTGGMIAYYLGRTLGRSAMKALTGRVMVFRKERGERYVGVLVFITRLLPVLSFDVISYAAGLSGLSTRVYAVATLLGMIPSTLFLTYVGSAFTVSLPLALGLSVIAGVLLVALPWCIRRYNWFGLRDSVQME